MIDLDFTDDLRRAVRCRREHLYSVQCTAPASGLYLGTDLAAALAAVRQSDLVRDGHVWLSAEHNGSHWCREESRAASADAGLPDDYTNDAASSEVAS